MNLITAAAAEPLDLAERNTLQYNEAIIAKGKKTFIEVADALARIRDGRLYRESHDTFEAYCRETWGMTKRNANLLIVEAEVAKGMGTMVPEINRRQARALAKVEPAKRAEVIEKAKATGEKLTARSIREAAAQEVEIIEPPKRGPETKRFDEFQKLHIEQQFLRLARRLAKETSESRHTDLLDAATKGINEGIRLGAEWRKEAGR